MISLSLLVLFGATLSQALPYSSSSPVVSLDASNFKSRIKNAGGALVEFYAPVSEMQAGSRSHNQSAGGGRSVEQMYACM
eukprot:1149020-Pelagomonas_calceolata.AAC.1